MEENVKKPDNKARRGPLNLAIYEAGSTSWSGRFTNADSPADTDLKRLSHVSPLLGRVRNGFTSQTVDKGSYGWPESHKKNMHLIRLILIYQESQRIMIFLPTFFVE
ncbi:hypothetical protein ABW19_dt0204425 [Dactylella cylindrospora]|nr:hypothetical protein ABW19_dt0204425 [Dactylella cylindrospora]